MPTQPELTGAITPEATDSATSAAPREPLGRLFLRFLRFGLLAWGGPVAQIGMIRQELVEEERWVSAPRFNRILSVYQVLPGPEAHELCVYFGMLSRGRVGAVLAGFGFMLPGFLLMFGLSALYVRYGLNSPLFSAAFSGFQAAVAALIVRALHGLGRHALTNRWLGAIALLAAAAHLLGVHFAVSLALAGLAYSGLKRGRLADPVRLGAIVLMVPAVVAARSVPSVADLFLSGLRSGLLTFGGAYTVIPFLQQDAVVRGAWMSNAQFLDGLALSSMLPAPLVIFATFVGYIGGGVPGSLALTAGIFLPAFGFTVLAHRSLERLVDHPGAHDFLDGVTAGVVGLMAATAALLLREALNSLPAVALFAVALPLLYLWRARAAVAVTILGAGLLGLLVFR